MTDIGARARFKKLAISAAAVLAIGLCYAAFVGITGLSVPCVFRLITKLKCPGCGMTTVCLSLLRLDFPAAWRANPAIVALSPLGAVVAADMAARYVKTGTRRPDGFCNAAMIFMSAVLLIFGAIRNFI